MKHDPTREFMKEVSDEYGIRLKKLAEAFELAKRGKVIEVKKLGDEVVGVACRFELGTETVYTVVGYYGARCTCRAYSIWGKLCTHILAALLLWNLTSILESGKKLDISRLKWLEELVEKEEE